MLFLVRAPEMNHQVPVPSNLENYNKYAFFLHEIPLTQQMSPEQCSQSSLLQ